MADSLKVPIERQMKHDKINQEQKLLDEADGRLDGIIKATQQDDVNLVITDAVFRQIDEMQDSIETNKIMPLTNKLTKNFFLYSRTES